jgi:hypothetical protein
MPVGRTAPRDEQGGLAARRDLRQSRRAGARDNQIGESERLGELWTLALRAAGLCSTDPLCAEHDPQPPRQALQSVPTALRRRPIP